jgi:hypothetical protein
MTEQTWLAFTDIHAKLNFLRNCSTHGFTVPTARKYRLLACGCCRLVWDLIDDPQNRSAIELAERLADRQATHDEVQAARFSGTSGLARKTLLRSPRMAAHDVVIPLGFNPKHTVVVDHLIRDIVGNPFRPVAVDPVWLTDSAVGLAQAIYDDRAFDRLPILADALQDAGCENADILDHCREEGPHVRGCWVVDLVLGKN